MQVSATNFASASSAYAVQGNTAAGHSQNGASASDGSAVQRGSDSVALSGGASQGGMSAEEMSKMLMMALMLKVLFGEQDEDQKKDGNSALITMMALSAGLSSDQLSSFYSSYDSSGSGQAAPVQSSGTTVDAVG